MSLPGAALVLVQVLPVSPAVLVSRILVLLYLAARPDYRAEIRRNYLAILGRDRPWFWVRNAWRVGRNLALMARIGQRAGDAIIDTAVVYGQNHGWHVLEQELHVTMASFHFGAWEYLPQVFARRGLQVRLAVGSQRDAGLRRRIGSLRRRSGVRLARSLKETAAGFGSAGITGFMLDNTSQGSQSWTEVDGIRLRIPDMPFRLAARSGHGVVPLFCCFEAGRLRIRALDAGDARAVAGALLSHVRARPAEWVFWGKAGAIAGQLSADSR